MTPRNNLEVQTKVISRARAFVGTYGGLSYLAPLYGVTSLAFYSHREKFSPQHLELARRVFGGFKRGSYVVLDTSDIDVLGLAFGDSHRWPAVNAPRKRSRRDDPLQRLVRRWPISTSSATTSQGGAPAR